MRHNMVVEVARNCLHERSFPRTQKVNDDMYDFRFTESPHQADEWLKKFVEYALEAINFFDIQSVALFTSKQVLRHEAIKDLANFLPRYSGGISWYPLAENLIVNYA